MTLGDVYEVDNLLLEHMIAFGTGTQVGLILEDFLGGWYLDSRRRGVPGVKYLT